MFKLTPVLLYVEREKEICSISYRLVAVQGKEAIQMYPLNRWIIRLKPCVGALV